MKLKEKLVRLWLTEISAPRTQGEFLLTSTNSESSGWVISIFLVFSLPFRLVQDIYQKIILESSPPSRRGWWTSHSLQNDNSL